MVLVTSNYPSDMERNDVANNKSLSDLVIWCETQQREMLLLDVVLQPCVLVFFWSCCIASEAGGGGENGGRRRFPERRKKVLRDDRWGFISSSESKHSHSLWHNAIPIPPGFLLRTTNNYWSDYLGPIKAGTNQVWHACLSEFEFFNQNSIRKYVLILSKCSWKIRGGGELRLNFII